MIRNIPFKLQLTCLLHELTETVPANKILSDGGDFRHAEGAYGHAQMARAIREVVMAEKVVSGYLLVEDAGELVQVVSAIHRSSNLRCSDSTAAFDTMLRGSRIDNREANGRIGANIWGQP